MPPDEHDDDPGLPPLPEAPETQVRTKINARLDALRMQMVRGTLDLWHNQCDEFERARGDVLSLVEDAAPFINRDATDAEFEHKTRVLAGATLRLIEIQQTITGLDRHDRHPTSRLIENLMQDAAGAFDNYRAGDVMGFGAPPMEALREVLDLFKEQIHGAAEARKAREARYAADAPPYPPAYDVVSMTDVGLGGMGLRTITNPAFAEIDAEYGGGEE
jgi:hypothetical protein